MGTEPADSRVEPSPDLFEVSRDPILVADLTTQSVVDANEAAVELLGYDRTEIVGRRVADLTPVGAETVGADIETALTEAAETGEHGFECRLERADGTVVLVDISLSRATFDGEERLLAFLRDVTDRRRQAAELRSSREALQRLHEITIEDADADTTIRQVLDTGTEFLDVDFAYVTDIDDETQTISHAVGHGVGLEIGDEAPIDETYCEHTAAGDDDETVRAVTDVAETEWGASAAVERFELGSYLGTALLVDGRQVGTVCFAATEPRDQPFTETERMFVDVAARLLGSVLERERREARLDEQRRQLKAAFNAPRSFIGILDTDGTLLRANETAWKFVDRDPEEFVGEKFWDGPWWDHSEPLQRQARDAVERARDGATVEFEATHVDAAGNEIDADVTIRPVIEGGEVTTIVAQGVDVTERNEREHRLEMQNQRLRTLFDNAPLIMYALDDEGVFLQSQGQGLADLGLEPGEVNGLHVEQVYGDNSEVVEMVDRALEGEKVESTVSVQGRWYRSWLQPILDDGRVTRVVGVSVDVTEQKRRENQVAAINEATRRLMYATSPTEVAETIVDIADETLDHSLATVCRYDQESETLDPVASNQALRDMLSAAGMDEVPTIDDDTVEMTIFEAGETRLIDDYANTEDTVIENVHPDVETVLVQPLGDFGTLHVAARTETEFGETEVRLLDTLARNAVAALARAEREAELKATKADLERSNERLQEFAYIASHDLQEPLRMVSSYVDLLAREYGDQLDDEADEYIEFAVDGAQRMQSMIDALLTYSRVHTQGADFAECDTESLVEETLQDLELLIEESDATVSVESLPTVAADRDQLGQVFRNLVKNAIDHADVDDAPTVTISGQRTDEGCRFAVADDGPGVPESQRDAIFEIFKRGDRTSDEGTGIGLAVCQRIVDRHGGDIRVESADDGGAKFVFTIPEDEEVTP
ncbi:PAS domain S-box protein [Halorientalis pallida]|uniref:PAS domain S-box protein n=1 Tax=Halorientalis pallida TaxID=2479928 RepID=UPI003C702CB5